jgi:hypothetical protein
VSFWISKRQEAIRAEVLSGKALSDFVSLKWCMLLMQAEA